MFGIWFLSLKTNVKKQSDTVLIIETGSGKNIFLILFSFILLFQLPMIKYSGIIVCFILWTYKNEWIFNKETEKMIFHSTFLWIHVSSKIVFYKNIKTLKISKNSNTEGTSFYDLLLITEDGKKFCITTISWCSRVKPEMDMIKPYLPTTTEYIIHENCFKKEKILSKDNY
jgi:hypothetical protein